MLEDQSIQHLISWSATNESFVMSPSSEFSKVLASYFKHTNISSFVRQLNMYGFHKVSDVFHTGSPDTPLWEFKHGNGSFKRGDLVGLRDIKRRASRHALIHRDSFSNAPKLPMQQQPNAPMESMPDPVEARLNILEYNFHDLHARLARTEDSFAAISLKCQVLSEALMRCHQWSNNLSSQLLNIVPDPSNPIHREVSSLCQDISKQTDILRSLDDHNDPLMPPRQTYFPANGPMDPGAPMSPRQMPQDNQRRPSLTNASHPGSFRAQAPPHFAASPHRYGSIGSGAYSPSTLRPGAYPPPPPPQPMPQVQPFTAPATSPSTGPPRRHTSADIRLHGWQGGQPPGQIHPAQQHGSSPYASGQSSSQWPSSPHRGPVNNAGDQQIRDALARYELPRNNADVGFARAPPPTTTTPPPSLPPPDGSNNPPPPPPPPAYANFGNEAGWQLPGPRFPFRGIEMSTGPPTRRSSMASNVHSLLNPADTMEREGEDEGLGLGLGQGLGWEERKRKRVGNNNPVPPPPPSDLCRFRQRGRLAAPRPPRFLFRASETSTMGLPTRRSSVGSHVHCLLNPADTMEREGEDEGLGLGQGLGLGWEERKRKRVG
ncbi:hypothetical protein LTR28_007900 [Elasticomyces elasticus]|nr:hypothetical protein LTR28_007900 [Elasticomyces elasticus]